MPPLARAGFSNGARAARPSGADDDRVGSLQDDDLVPASCRIPGGGLPRAIVVGQIAVGGGRDPAGRAEPGELARVRGQDARPSDPLPPLVADGERAERLGVDDRRWRVALTLDGEQGADQVGRGQARPQPGSDDERVMLVVHDPGEGVLGLDLLDVVLGEGHRRRLDDLRREQRLERLGDGQGDQTGAGPSGRPADEQRGARVVERAGDHKELAERALVAAGRALRDQRGDGLVVEHLERGR